MSDNNLIEALIRTRSILNKNQAEMAAMLNISLRAYQNYEQGKRYPSKTIESKIISTLRTLNTYETLDLPVHIANEPAINYKSANIIHVPLFAFGGFLRGYERKVFTDTLEHYTLPGITGTHYSFEIQGMSMYNSEDSRSAAPGDFAISRAEHELLSMVKEKGYILQTIDGIVYKIFDRIEGEEAFFHSLNSEYNGYQVHLKSLKKVYLVVRILKNPYT